MIRYQCSICYQWMRTPNNLRDHMFTHKDKRSMCGHCNKRFTFQSGLNLHRNICRCRQLYECFPTGCNHKYKWPQDLPRHIKVHLKISLKCEHCEYTTHDRRLLRQHLMYIVSNTSTSV